MLNKVRDASSRALEPVARAFVKAGLPPNAVSALGVAAAFLSAALYLNRQIYPAATLLLLSGLLDSIDGLVARAMGRATRLGAFLDSLLDRYADAAVIASIILANLCDPLAGVVALIGTLLVSYVRARGESLGVEMSGVGVMERAERILVLAVASYLNAIWLAIALLAILTNLTVLQRAYFAWGSLK